MEARRDDLLRLGMGRSSWTLKWKEVERFKRFLRARNEISTLVTPDSIVDYLTQRSFTNSSTGFAALTTMTTIRSRIATYLDQKGYLSKNPCRQALVDLWEAGYASSLWTWESGITNFRLETGSRGQTTHFWRSKNSTVQGSIFSQKILLAKLGQKMVAMRKFRFPLNSHLGIKVRRSAHFRARGYKNILTHFMISAIREN